MRRCVHRLAVGSSLVIAAVTIGSLAATAQTKDPVGREEQEAAALAAGLVFVEVLVPGEGPSPEPGGVVFADYVLYLADGTLMDRSPPLDRLAPEIARRVPRGMPIFIDRMPPGFSEALRSVQAGGQYHFAVPAAQAYGDSPPAGGPVPSNANLYMDLTVHYVMKPDEAFRQRDDIDAIYEASRPAGGAS